MAEWSLLPHSMGLGLLEQEPQAGERLEVGGPEQGPQAEQLGLARELLLLEPQLAGPAEQRPVWGAK